MRFGPEFLPRIFIVAVVFPLLVGVFGSIFRLLAELVFRIAPVDSAGRDLLATVCLIVGLLVGVWGAFNICRWMWSRTGP